MSRRNKKKVGKEIRDSFSGGVILFWASVTVAFSSVTSYVYLPFFSVATIVTILCSSSVTNFIILVLSSFTSGGLVLVSVTIAVSVFCSSVTSL